MLDTYTSCTHAAAAAAAAFSHRSQSHRCSARARQLHRGKTSTDVCFFVHRPALRAAGADPSARARTRLCVFKVPVQDVAFRMWSDLSQCAAESFTPRWMTRTSPKAPAVQFHFSTVLQCLPCPGAERRVEPRGGRGERVSVQQVI